MKNKIMYILLIISVLIIFFLVFKIVNQGKSLSSIRNKPMEVPTVKIESLNKEFTLHLRETAIVENLQITAEKNLVRFIKSSNTQSPDDKNGIRIIVKEGDKITRHDFEDGKDNVLNLDKFTIQLKSRIPGQGTFIVSRK